MRYEEHAPCAALADVIECLWIVSDRSRRSRAPERVLPDGCPEWIVHLEDPFARQVDGRWRRQSKNFFAGTLSKPWLLRAGPRLRTFGIRFKPGAAAGFFRRSLTGTADREVDIRKLIGRRAGSLSRELQEKRTDKQRFIVAERFLVQMIGARTLPVAKTAEAVIRIRRSRGRIRVAELAEELGLTRRTLERIFDRELAISPKQYARIVRLNAVLATLSADDRIRAVDLALDAGYFDEAHLLRDFRALAGRRLRSADAGGLAKHFTRPDRLRRLLADGE